jgi:error-prone DNA polymerase
MHHCYAELAITSSYTFLAGASQPEEFVERAAALGHCAAAISDLNTLAGIVRAHGAAKEVGIPLAVGSRLRLAEPVAVELLVFPSQRRAYAGLCRLLTTGKRRVPKGQCHLVLEDLLAHDEGLLAVILPPPRPDDRFIGMLRRLRGHFDEDRLSLAAARPMLADDASRLHALAALARAEGVPLAAVNDVHHHLPRRRALQDILTCIRHGCTIHEAGWRLHANAERHLKPASEMRRLFTGHASALSRSAEIARRAAAFSLDELRYEYPQETCPSGMTPTSFLAECTWAGAAKRYPDGVPAEARSQILHELALIAELRYEPYFLTCHDIVRFARGRGILCQGRGGAANSAVCYCLGITEVDPARFSLLFERFISRARREPPDIDIDFEHERREEVIQHLYTKYGRDRAALTAEVIAYRGRSAVRDVGKAMGLPLDCVDTIARHLGAWCEAPDEQRVREAGLNPEEPTIRQVIELSQELAGFPRHLSQHVGGFVITRTPLSELVPIENAAMEDRTVIEWDKDDIDAMGMLKIDVLGLGMLTCIRKAFDLVAEEPPDAAGVSRRRRCTIARVMSEFAEDPEVYAMIQKADTVGVFQIESRAQMSMLPRLRPKTFYDLVIEVAIVRPGPIQGKMVHPYLRRRQGEEQVRFPSAEVEAVLGRTLGVPLFQEQAMQLAIVAAGFTPDEADGLRRAMAAWKRKGQRIHRYGEQLIEGMIRNGHQREFAERCFEQIKGFSEYGFPESHAASFAILVYVSAWLKRWHPAAFAAALINSQPMGFYAPAQIVRDLREHGVEVRGVDVARSAWDCAVEEGTCSESPLPALRLGLRLVKGLSREDGERIVAAVARHGPQSSVERLWSLSGATVAGLRRLAHADAFRSMGLDRQAALWRIRPLRDESMPLFERIEMVEEDGASRLPPFSLQRHMLHDYASVGLSLEAHPMTFLRSAMERQGVIPAMELRCDTRSPQGRLVQVAGLVLVRQRPSTASGVVFITLEDETGVANLVIWPRVFERFRTVARLSSLLRVRGRVERQGETVHVKVEHVASLDEMAAGLEAKSRDFH